jgi:hypothetical protein
MDTASSAAGSEAAAAASSDASVPVDVSPAAVQERASVVGEGPLESESVEPTAPTVAEPAETLDELPFPDFSDAVLPEIFGSPGHVAASVVDHFLDFIAVPEVGTSAGPLEIVLPAEISALFVASAVRTFAAMSAAEVEDIIALQFGLSAAQRRVLRGQIDVAVQAEQRVVQVLLASVNGLQPSDPAFADGLSRLRSLVNDVLERPGSEV